ncbi:hypothetical protein COU80_03425 [Candidatus Peregrinibacteria bacterium CG10_big_fil_rev_8_21_14_0_10_55_24]|nr:MAG: hypothetical protein COU80_03425 [Candidatus Peregrinibacteria bacterium CG10_big_fil_rev_8_21_14_0_10_55_24]
MYRAYWAIPRTLKRRDGEQMNAVFGMASMLLSILQKEEPDFLLTCFDEGEETFRHQEAEGYKEGRAETPDDFYAQIPRIIELLDTFHIRHVSDPRFEADDLLCAYARKAEGKNMRVTVVSGDRDLLQIVSPSIRIALPHKGYQQTEYLDPAGVEEKYGIRPNQVASYKGLCGDTSDNLPGVRGIGPKTAVELLQAYDSLDGVYAHLADVRPAVREKLEHDREQAFFCQRMAQLISDMELHFSIDDLRLIALPTDDILAFFTTMEFTLLTKRFQNFLATPFGQSHFEQPSKPLPQVRGRDDQLTLF